MIRRIFSRMVPLLASLYLIGAMLPITAFWYDPGQVVIRDTVQGVSPEIEFFRHIKRPVLIQYSVLVRREADPAPVCEGASPAPREYQPINGVLTGRNLEWWVGNSSCNDLPPGRYWVQTCWTAVTPMRAILPSFLQNSLGWLLPPKSICKPAASEWGNSYTFEIRRQR